MSVNRKWSQVAIGLSALIAWVGCSKTPSGPAGSNRTNAKAEHFDGDGHDHDAKKGDRHAHAEEGPHHGHLIELGQEEYHMELTHDEATKTVSIYLLDGSAKQAVPIPDPEITLNLVVNGKPRQAKLGATPQIGDPAGQSSRFSAVDEELLEALESPKTKGRINVTIKDKSYVGEIVHDAHDDHKQ